MTEAIVFNMDCREFLGATGDRFDFVFADPPFNIGHPYAGYDDRRSDFGRFIVECMRATASVCSGVMVWHGPDALAEIYLDVARREGWQRIAWLNWHYRFGQCTRANWVDARCHCLVYAMTPYPTWNPEEVLVDSDRVAYGGKRIHETERGGKRLPGTVWGVPSDGPNWGRVTGSSAERRPGHPNQLPEVYLERLIRAYTNPGDWVFDPFGGSGTTAVVAQALGRNVVTCDVSEENCKSIQDRLLKGAVRINQESIQ